MVRTARFADLDPTTLYALLRLRVDVFVVEQRCPYPELDGRDLEPDTRHLWLERAGTPVAYLRILTEPDGAARIGRVVVAPAHRGQGLARRLLTEALAQLSGHRCVLAAQTYLVDFYASFGFAPVEDEFLEDGIPHISMRRPG